MDRREFLEKACLLVGGSFISLNFGIPINDEKYFGKLRDVYDEMSLEYSIGNNNSALILDGEKQKMYLVGREKDDFFVEKNYSISTSRNGFGGELFSGKTPLGVHIISEKIGDGLASGSILSRGKSIDKIADVTYDEKDLHNSFVTSRVLRLSGCEDINLESFRRGIFIHGTSREGSLGAANSGGCIRMGNSDVIELYDLVDVGTYLNVLEKI